MSAPPTIPLDQIPDEGLALDVPFDADWLEGIAREHGYSLVKGAPAGAKVRLDLDANERDVTLSGEFEVTLWAECVACLEPVEVPTHTTFQLHLGPRPEGRPNRHEEVELSADELDADWYTDKAIDLAHWLREQVLLEAPVHPRHAGECPVTLRPPTTDAGSQTREIDPRLLPLRNFSVTKKE